MSSLRDKADSVRLAVSSTSTCSAATVTILNALLLGDNGDSSINKEPDGKPIARGRPKAATSISTTKTSKSAKGGATAKSGQQTLQLSPKEKGILATEVINATLKVLGTPVKTPAPIRPRPSQDLMKESVRRALRRSNSLPHSPLQPRTLHRVSSSPNVSRRLSRSSSSASCTASGTRATAECARVAFSCLRILQLSKTSCMSDLPPYQLENGMSALIGKLIILGLDDLALKELRILKRRLEPSPKLPNKPAREKSRSTDITQTATAKPQNLAEILHFQVAPDPGPCLTLAIATQLHALKLLSSSKKPSLIDASLTTLQHEFSGSPVQLLLRAAAASSMPLPKAAKQLDTLSYLILSLCPSVSSSEDDIAITSNLNPSPDVILKLQALSFHIRILWWSLVGHQGDVEKDILDPFSKCLIAFARRSQHKSDETYKIALGALQNVQGSISTYDKKSTTATISSTSGIYRILGSLAQESGCYKDAIQWIEEAQHRSHETDSEARRCSIAASLVAMKLMTAPNDIKIEELLMEVIEGISGSLKGASQDLDDLLTEVSHARRAAISLLSNRRTGSSNYTVGVSDGVRQMCESLVLQCPRFTLRFLGPSPDANASLKSIVRHQQLRKFVAKSASNAIDSALYLIKTFQCDGCLTWDLMDSTLQDCLALLEAIDNCEAENEIVDDRKEAATSYFVKLSNLYYAQHLNMKRDSENSKDVQHLRPLRRSIDCVLRRPRYEKEAAILLSKLERISNIYRSVDRLDEARESLVLLRDELVADGALAKVAAAAENRPIRTAWEYEDDTAMLGRTNANILKLEIKLGRKASGLAWCHSSWSIQEKGVILEHCLDIILKPAKEALELQRNAFNQLLSLYESKAFPIRRLRVLIQVLNLDPGRRRDVADDVKSTVAVAGMKNVVMESKDSDLIRYVPHLQALASTILELQEDHPRIDLLRPHLAIWYSIIETSKNYESLTCQIDDVSDLVNHLHSIADFLHMKGFCSIRIAVLKMVANINELPRPNLGPDDLILNYCTLASQYLELGYSGRAGLALDRAHSLNHQNGVRPETSLRIYLSHAEYLITIGNVNKW
jgi:separase